MLGVVRLLGGAVIKFRGARGWVDPPRELPALLLVLAGWCMSNVTTSSGRVQDMEGHGEVKGGLRKTMFPMFEYLCIGADVYCNLLTLEH